MEKDQFITQPVYLSPRRRAEIIYPADIDSEDIRLIYKALDRINEEITQKAGGMLIKDGNCIS